MLPVVMVIMSDMLELRDLAMLPRPGRTIEGLAPILVADVGMVRFTVSETRAATKVSSEAPVVTH